MIYDCFQFFNELDILKLRLEIMDPIVDWFVISEATETFSGLKKPVYYEENKELFSKFAHKIIHVVVEDTPPGYTHDRDTFQKNAVGRGLVDCKDDDIILFSDLDEIPNPEKVREILADFDSSKVYHFAQRMFYCYLNMEEISGKLLSYAGDFEGISKKQWIGSKLCSYGLIRENQWQLGELRFPERKEIGIRVADGGWHFGYMGGKGEKNVKARIAQKVKSAAHDEYNKEEILDSTADLLRAGKDIFGRDAQFVCVDIDESYPVYLREHLSEYDWLILQPEKTLEKVARLVRVCWRKVKYFAKRVIRKLLRMAGIIKE